MTSPRLSVRDLQVTYTTKHDAVHAVDRVSFDVQNDEIFGIVGESGCGKSTLASTILRLLDDNGEITGGEIRYGDWDLAAMSDRELARQIRGREISMVFQDPNTSLDPVYTIGRQLIETIRQHLDVSKQEARKRAIQSLADVGIPSPEDRLDDYPHQFSGGMRQRVVIAIALSCNPGLLIADEPTTGLDVSIQAQILDLLEDINDNHDTSVILITHDLGVVAEVCDRVGVMYAGNLVEISPVDVVYDDPKHPYTEDLLRSIPETHEMKSELTVIKGTPPDLRDPPSGCRYHPRCTKVCSDACETGDIPQVYRENGSTVRCYLYDPAENPEYEGSTEGDGERPDGQLEHPEGGEQR
ncbi:peptide/nickel transport system ATP-binding protein [Halogranum gelatinilyticum]|uniref:Peptide/nickel transport system ATP-binding protein n=1 Tax=Halogranum gelatinilyticum TaxID=660521 RepID=A0A1G9YZY1_9EURY|nr:ABC transporter ATP-binding protein [Halogranum gelatinilyticum]SDN14634.1 peptide/nickel transport system ATP-binding protein [Halogranum gelatinilyticum]